MDTNLPISSKDPMMLTQHHADYKTYRMSGMIAERAFEKAFQDDPEWFEFFDSLPTDPKKQRERQVKLRWAARELDQRKEMKQLQEAINARVTDLSTVALDTMEQIMVESKSDKVRADVAIEILRQNVGSPDKGGEGGLNIQVVVGKDPTLGVVDGEVVDDRF